MPVPEIELVSYVEKPRITDSEVQFMTTLISLSMHLIGNDELLDKTSANKEEMGKFLNSLHSGFAEKLGEDKDCRSVCVTVQGALEEGITVLLKNGELTKAKAVFLTPLPCTPLRKKGTQVNTGEEFDPPRQYTLDKRENTVRALRKAGGEIVVAYVGEEYEKLKMKEDPISKQEVMVWESERAQIHTQEIVLKEHPGTLVGALYLLEDKNGGKYYLVTQGIQAHEAKPGEWRKWFCLAADETHSGFRRAKEMLNFIKINSENGTEIAF